MVITKTLKDLTAWLKSLTAIEAIEFYVEDVKVEVVYSIEEFEEVFKEVPGFKAFSYQILSDGLDEENPKRRIYWFYALQSSRHDIKIYESLN